MVFLKNLLGSFFIFAGLIAIAGSAGDCDGDCMEYANTMEQMVFVICIGMTLVGTGAYILYKNYND